MLHSFEDEARRDEGDAAAKLLRELGYAPVWPGTPGGPYVVWKKATATWSPDWPTTPGRYWFYGWRSKFTEGKRALHIVRVQQAVNTVVYTCDGAFMYTEEGAAGVFLPLPEPELPR